MIEPSEIVDIFEKYIGPSGLRLLRLWSLYYNSTTMLLQRLMNYSETLFKTASDFRFCVFHRHYGLK